MLDKFIKTLLIIIATLLLANVISTFKPFQLIMERSNDMPFVGYRLNSYTGSINPLFYDDSTKELVILHPAISIEEWNKNYNPVKSKR